LNSASKSVTATSTTSVSSSTANILSPQATLASKSGSTRPKRTLQEVKDWRTHHDRKRQCSVCGVQRSVGFGHSCTSCSLNVCFNLFDPASNCCLREGVEEPAVVKCDVCCGMEYHIDRTGSKLGLKPNLFGFIPNILGFIPNILGFNTFCLCGAC
jgi:hypothetical protein